MSLINLDKFPAPYFGGKTDAAPAIWSALGDVDHYVVPFCGTCAELLLRPHRANRTYHSETVNDADGLLVNALRSIKFSPRETAEAASWYVAEADLHARHLAILKWQAERDLERLMGDPKFHDPLIAGYWLWGLCCWIGSGWCSGIGPWIVGHDGRITRRPSKDVRGVWRQLPNVSNNGRGLLHPDTREPGVSRKLPHVANDGRGVNRPQAREPGVSRQIPHVNSNGAGVNRPQAREPGVSRQIPHVSNDGQGVNRPQAREPGVSVSVDGDEPLVTDLDDGRVFHPMTMPELLRWFEFLSARLRHVRILNGTYKRCLTSGVLKTITVRQGKGKTGVYLDPPYRATDTRDDNLYTHDNGDEISPEVRAWCLKNGDDPDLRIVLSGYAGEGHEELEKHGWRVKSWFTSGFLKGGLAQQSEEGHQQDRERLWLSPHCLRDPEPPKQHSLFAEET